MKVLSGYAEWVWLMGKNIKDVENRSWSLASRGIKRSQLPMHIYLHASKTKPPLHERTFIVRNLTYSQLMEYRRIEWEKLRGSIIGEITIVDEIQADDIGIKESHSRWFFGKYGIVVKDGVLYDTQIPCRGKPGFFELEIKSKLPE